MTCTIYKNVHANLVQALSSWRSNTFCLFFKIVSFEMQAASLVSNAKQGN